LLDGLCIPLVASGIITDRGRSEVSYNNLLVDDFLTLRILLSS
jgi:hypothetical protein